MYKKHLKMLLLFVLLLSLVLAACAPAATETVTDEGTVGEEAPEGEVVEETCSLRIGYVSDVGRINDQSFNQASWTGVEEGAMALGLSEECYSFIETTDSADYEVNIRSFVEEGYNIIVTSGFAMGQVTRLVASEYPEVYFIGVDQQQVNEEFVPDPYPNVAGLNFHEDIGGFLAGAVAGLMTETNVVGGVFGCQFIPAVARYEVGYHNGVTYVNPDATILNVYHPGSIDVCFADAAFGSETAQSLVGEGADVVYGAGGLTANGAMITACNQGAYVIGTDMDQYLTLPEVSGCILSSALKDIVTGVSDLIVAVDAGTFEGGDTFGPSMLAPFHELEDVVPDDVQATLATIAEQLASGELDPCTPFEGSNPNTFCVPVNP